MISETMVVHLQCCLWIPSEEEAKKNEWLIGRFSVFQHLHRTISSILPYAMTPLACKVSIFIHSFIYFCLSETQCGYFFAVLFVSIISTSAFYQCRSDNFFVSAIEMVHLILACSLLLDINNSLMPRLPFIFKMTIIYYICL